MHDKLQLNNLSKVVNDIKTTSEMRILVVRNDLSAIDFCPRCLILLPLHTESHLGVSLVSQAVHVLQILANHVDLQCANSFALLLDIFDLSLQNGLNFVVSYVH